MEYQVPNSPVTNDIPSQMIKPVVGKLEIDPAVRVVTIPQVMDESRLRRQRYSKNTIRQWLESMSDPYPEQYLPFHDDHLDFDHVCAGAKHHHWWRGGMADHVKEMIGYALDLYDLYPGDLKDKVDKDEIIQACYLHDFAKIWSYREITEEDREKSPSKYLEAQVFTYQNGNFDIVDEESKTLLELARWGIVPSEQVWSAVLFAEGGYADRNFTFGGTSSTGQTVMARNPLAVIVHMADMYSAMILGRSLV